MKQLHPLSASLTKLNIPHIYQPSKNGEQKNLIVVLHGRGDSAEGFTWFQPALKIDSLNFLLMQAPDDYYGGYSWYDMPPNQLPGILRSRLILEKVFSEIEKNGFNLNECFLFGFSQGCLMTLEFGARFPRKLKGYIGISGYCYNVDQLLAEASPEIIQQGNWFIDHGTHDDVLPIETTRAQMKTLMEKGFKMDYREYKKVHTIDEENELSDIREWITSHSTS